MKTLFAALALLLACVVPAAAQPLHTHGHPQGDYLSPANYPTFSGQAHWLLPGGPLTHVHADLTCPYLAEVQGPVTCGFAVTLHHFKGRVTSVDLGYHTVFGARDIVWDATGSSTQPDMVGDPDNTLVWTGHFTVDLPANVIHWWYFTNTVKARFDNGDAIMAKLLVPMWSMNVAQPGVEVLEGFLPFLSSRAEVTSTAHPNTDTFGYGATTAEYVDPMPIAPISTPWPVRMQFYSYGSHNLPASTDEIRRDLDLHHNIPGVTLFERTQVDDLGLPFPIGTGFAPGTHKVALVRTQPNAEEVLASLLVGVVTIDPNAPPSPAVPPDFTPPPPPPPPPPATLPTWEPVTAVVERFGTTNRFRLRVGNEIFEFVFQP